MTQPLDDYNNDPGVIASKLAMWYAAMNSSVIKHDRYDQRMYEKTKERSEETQNLLESAEATYIPNFSTLIEETFYSFFKTVPLFESEDTITKTARIRRKMLEQMMQTQEYRRIKDAGSAGDEYTSILAANAVGQGYIDKLSEETKEKLRKLKNTEKYAQELQQDLQKLEQQRLEATNPEQQAQLDQQIVATQAQAQQWENATTKAAETIEEMIEEIEDEARRAARAGLKAAEEEIEGTQAAMQIFGNYGMGQGEAIDAGDMQTKFQLGEQLRSNKKLLEIAKLAGKFINIAMQKHRTKTILPPDEVVGVTTGNKLPLVLRRERLQLRRGELGKLVFFTKYQNKGLMQRDMIGHEPQGQGPFCLFIDTSGSMTETLSTDYKTVYSKEVWAKAIAIAIMKLAEREHRDFMVTHFSGKNQLKTWKFPKGKAPAKIMAEWCTHMFNGGTDFDGWMQESLIQIEEDTFENADIIIISDGVGRITESIKNDYNSRRAIKKAHTYGILLATEEERKLFQAEEKMTSLTDKMITITDLKHSEEVFNTIFTL